MRTDEIFAIISDGLRAAGYDTVDLPAASPGTMVANLDFHNACNTTTGVYSYPVSCRLLRAADFPVSPGPGRSGRAASPSPIVLRQAMPARRPHKAHPRLARACRRLLAGIAVMFVLGVGAATGGEVFRFGLSASPVTLDPRFATDAASERICRLLYGRLIDFDTHYQVVPRLAQWRQLSPTLYRFTLDGAGRSFHDGSRLTAADVKATYDFILDAKNASPHRGSLAMIARIETPDDDRVEFHLSRPDALFPGRLVIGILPKALIEAAHEFNHDPVGSGPLRFVRWPDESHLILERTLDGARVEFLTVPNPTVRALKLARGEIDILQGDIPPEILGWTQRQAGAVVRRARGDTFVYLGFNLQDPVVGRREVREAIARALDREAIIRHVLRGAAQPASSLLSADHWAGNPGLPGYPHDPGRARALLDAAGYGPGHPLRLVYKTSNDPFRVRLATIIQSQLKDAGIDVDLRSYDWGTFYGDIRAGRFQMYGLSWVGLTLPDIFRYAFHSRSVPPAGANRGRYESREVDALIEQAEAAPQPASQAAIYREIEARLYRDLPYVPLWYEDVAVAARRDIAGYAPARDGNYDGLITIRRVH